MKRFLAIPVLILAYIFLIDVLSQMDFSDINSNEMIESGGMARVGFGQSISVYVTRPYLFGLIRLPVYSENMGYIGDYHDAFFMFIFVLTIALIVTEFKHKKDIKGKKTKSKKR
jgi:hypothetical protein